MPSQDIITPQYLIIIAAIAVLGLFSFKVGYVFGSDLAASKNAERISNGQK